jgi:hypothetical protein
MKGNPVTLFETTLAAVHAVHTLALLISSFCLIVAAIKRGRKRRYWALWAAIGKFYGTAVLLCGDSLIAWMERFMT